MLTQNYYLKKWLTDRLRVIPKLIHPTQAGFTKGRYATANIRKVVAVLEYARNNPKEDLAILSRKGI